MNYLLLYFTITIILCGARSKGLGGQSNADTHYSSGKMNVVFIMSDDLRTDLSIYGRSHVISPNFERLAKRSVNFDKAYNQLPVCFPSRHSLLTGMRPDSIGIHTWTEAQAPYVDTLFSILVRNNYHSAGLGKLFHHPHNGSSEFPDGRWDGYWYRYQNLEAMYLNSSTTPDSVWREEDFRDYVIASHGIEKIKELNEKSKETKKPFMVSIGFKQPHTQYHLPRKYFEMYRDSPHLAAIMKSGQNNSKYAFPPGAPRMNYRCCAMFKFWPMVKDGREKSEKGNQGEVLYGKMRFSNQAIMELQWGYLGGISYLDAMLGRVLDTLEDLRLLDNTMIVLTSDHGMHIGEKGMWEKYTLFEETTRVPLIISHPHFRQHWGKHYTRPVELVDIIPTMLDLLNIERNPVKCPRSKLCFEFDGKSVADAVRLGPNARIPGNAFAISQIRRCPYLKTEKPISSHPEDKWNAICNLKNKPKGSVMGYSLRSNEWRYTAWFWYDHKKKRPDVSRQLVAEELYSHVGAGPQDLDIEVENIAYSDSKKIQAVREDHRDQLLHFLATQANFGIMAAVNRTKEKYSPFFVLDGSGRAVRERVSQAHNDLPVK